MKKSLLLIALLTTAFTAFAAVDDSHFKWSLWGDEASAFPNNNLRNVRGLDLGIGSKTDRMKGVQLDLVWGETDYILRGASFGGMVNIANRISGFQTAAYVQANEVHGMQLGGVNFARSLDGVQAGFYNQADEVVYGLQIGIVNQAYHMEQGCQIGLVNIAHNGFWPVMILMNGRF